jgi:hypothetical protein
VSSSLLSFTGFYLLDGEFFAAAVNVKRIVEPDSGRHFVSRARERAAVFQYSEQAAFKRDRVITAYRTPAFKAEYFAQIQFSQRNMRVPGISGSLANLALVLGKGILERKLFASSIADMPASPSSFTNRSR